MDKPTTATQDIGYFYDTIHGRVNFGDLPPSFEEALKVALRSRAIDRLTRIAQLGHTSLTYFSATQTRFSHAIGTLLMMNKLFRHVYKTRLPSAIVDELNPYAAALAQWPDAETFVWCHLLLVALYQDCGELPFQKVTSLYIRPDEGLTHQFDAPYDAPLVSTMKGKEVFTLAALHDDLKELSTYDFRLLAYLITGKGALGPDTHLRVLRQMVDGAIDADRLDYVFRDALLTIGSMSRPDTVLNSIKRYEADCVVVDDPRPAADFLATRARLWTFVYASPDVRFRQALLRAFLQSGFGSRQGIDAFKTVDLHSEIGLSGFLSLDDHSMLDRMRRLKSTTRGRDPWFAKLEQYGQNACDVLLQTVTDYRCEIDRRPAPPWPASRGNVPNGVFFDLLYDHDERHKSYVPGTIRVESHFTKRMDQEERPVALELCTGALAPLFLDETSRIPLVKDSFLLFTKKHPQAGEEAWITDARANGWLYDALSRADFERDLQRPHDTWDRNGFRLPKIAVSCSFKDRDAVIRLMQAIHGEKQKYRLLLESVLWLEGTPIENSRRLIEAAGAALVIASPAYLKSATDLESCIAAEVRAIHEKANNPKFAVIVVSLDARVSLSNINGWNWVSLAERFRSEPSIIAENLRYERQAGLETVAAAIVRSFGESRR